MRRPNSVELKTLFDFLGRKASELRSPCRWLSVAADLGDERASVILEGHSEPATAAELTDLLRLLQRDAMELAPFGRWLARHSEHWQEARVELQLDLLIAADIDSWEHPTQILERPRPNFEQLLEACVARRKAARGARLQLLERVEAKVARAARIAASARSRRERMLQKKRRARSRKPLSEGR